MSPWNQISDHIAQTTGAPFRATKNQTVSGGCINAAYLLEGENGRYFVKLNDADRLDMFEAEADGLAAMAATNSVRVPRPLCSGIVGGQSYLVMEYIETGVPGKDAAADLGHQLATMHRSTTRQFGWERNNTIGSTPQPNTGADDWVDFWRDQRLGHQLELAQRNGHGGALQRSGRELMAQLDQVLGEHRPTPSLLHGDLWSGNHASDCDGHPIIFDPAVYYGDREADLAMTELFGGFPRSFYDAYRQAWPLDDGYPRRRTLYNTYHILNHLNLFGGGYGSQALTMIQRLLEHP